MVAMLKLGRYMYAYHMNRLDSWLICHLSVCWRQRFDQRSHAKSELTLTCWNVLIYALALS